MIPLANRLVSFTLTQNEMWEIIDALELAADLPYPEESEARQIAYTDRLLTLRNKIRDQAKREGFAL